MNHPAKGFVEEYWLKYIPIYKVGDRFKFEKTHKTVWEVLKIVKRGVVICVFHSTMARKGSHESLAEWKHIAHSIKAS